MVKSPAKAAKPLVKTLKAAPKPKSAAGTAKPAVKKPEATSVEGDAATKSKPTSKAKLAAVEASTSGIAHFVKDTSETLSKLASDILEDRIIPTIEQIKAVAAHALRRGNSAKPKAKASKKK